MTRKHSRQVGYESAVPPKIFQIKGIPARPATATLKKGLGDIPRNRWPYRALLPHSIKIFPIVQVADSIGPQSLASWPPPIDPQVEAWRERISCDAQNQIYIHVPFCPFLCHFCPLFKVESNKDRTDDQKEAYVKAVIAEIGTYAKIQSLTERRYHAIYFGGGSPTELSPSQLRRILTAVRSNFNVTQDAEITLEGVARQMLSPDYFSTCAQDGFNRISFGVQSLDSQVRRRIGRGDDVEDYYSLIEMVRRHQSDFPINVEIMAGLPEQGYSSFLTDVEQLLQWQTSSVDILYYVMMPGTKLHQLVSRGKRASPHYGADLLRMRQLANNAFQSGGYRQLTGEVFARTDRDLFVQTSFGGGWSGLNTVLAVGPSAFGLLGGTIYHNVCDLQKYIEVSRRELLPINTARNLDLRTARRRAMLLAILRLAVPRNLVEGIHDRMLVRKWKRLGLIEDDGSFYRLTELGKLWYNHMQIDLLPLTETMKSIRLFGSVHDQLEAVTGRKTRTSQDEELLDMIRSSGRIGFLRLVAYRSLLRILQ
jgi:oxygen-independent coproporphyrinogen-3 oxidase